MNVENERDFFTLLESICNSVYSHVFAGAIFLLGQGTEKDRYA